MFYEWTISIIKIIRESKNAAGITLRLVNM